MYVYIFICIHTYLDEQSYSVCVRSADVNTDALRTPSTSSSHWTLMLSSAGQRPQRTSKLLLLLSAEGRPAEAAADLARTPRCRRSSKEAAPTRRPADAAASSPGRRRHAERLLQEAGTCFSFFSSSVVDELMKL